jgi:hypothetical protein
MLKPEKAIMMGDGLMTYSAQPVATAGETRHLLEAVNKASAASNSAWLIHLALSAYFIVALAGISHADLLLNSPIALPILGISIALDRFFLFAPLFYILIHIGVMLQYVVLTRKVYAFLDVVEHEERRLTAGNGERHVHPLRYELNSNMFVQFLAGPPQPRLVRFLQQVITWGTLVMLAACVLIYFQVAFLPYHDTGISWAHRAYVLIDLGIVALLGTFLSSPLTGFWASFFYGLRRHTLFFLTSVALFACFFAFSLFVASVPGDHIDETMAAIGPSVTVPAPSGNPAHSRRVFLPTAWLFEGKVDPDTGERESPFLRNLVVMDRDLVNDAGIGPGDVSLSLRYRDLRYARLDRSDLKQADLSGADLTGASLEGADLSGARR